jgi:hypothetical protein
MWPRTLPPMPMRGTEAAPTSSAAPPPSGPEPPVNRPPVRPPLSPLEAEASLLASLPRYAPRGRSGGPGQMPPPAATPRPTIDVARDAGPPRPPADVPLTRRVAGAQMPPTEVVPLHDDVPAAPPARLPPAAFTAATDVRALLTTFTAGVQRGLEESRQRRAAAASAGNGHNGLR